MSQDLLTQLAEYGTYCDERQGSVSADDVIDAIVPLPMPTPPTAPRRGWLVALAAAAVILIVIGGVTWLTSFSDSIAPDRRAHRDDNSRNHGPGDDGSRHARDDHTPDHTACRTAGGDRGVDRGHRGQPSPQRSH